MMQAVTSISYFKRYKMEADLKDLPPLRLPAGYQCRAWAPEVLNTHAEGLFAWFEQEIHANAFASLSSRAGCLNLVPEQSLKPHFRAAAPWVLLVPCRPRRT